MLIHSYSPAASLKVTGEDAAAFLQGQFTNELRQGVGAAVYGLWLNQKGKVLADSHVLKLAENEFQIVSTTSAVAVIRSRLEEYIVADDVTLADETTLVQGLTVYGLRSGEIMTAVLGAAPHAGQFARPKAGWLFAGRRIRGENYELIGPVAFIAGMKTELLARGARETAAMELEFSRIMDGMPVVPQDIGPGDLPNEGGLEEEAISFTKGCYLGQEIMARLKNMGKIRRRLHVVHGQGAPPAPLALLYQGGKKIGQIRSMATRENELAALAMVSLVNLDPSVGLSLEPEATPTLAIIPRG